MDGLAIPSRNLSVKVISPRNAERSANRLKNVANQLQNVRRQQSAERRPAWLNCSGWRIGDSRKVRYGGRQVCQPRRDIRIKECRWNVSTHNDRRNIGENGRRVGEQRRHHWSDCLVRIYWPNFLVRVHRPNRVSRLPGGRHGTKRSRGSAGRAGRRLRRHLVLRNSNAAGMICCAGI